MNKLSYVKTFKVGCFDCEADASGEIVIYPNQEAGDMDRKRQSFSISVDEINQISDMAYRHKVDYENGEIVITDDTPDPINGFDYA